MRALATIGAFALALLCPHDAGARLTPMSEAAISTALQLGHRDVFGHRASLPRLRVARAQVALEVGRGRATYCNNLGNIGAHRREPHCYTRTGFRVRKYATARAGARAYWRLSAVRKALAFFDTGDARGAAFALRRAGYYTAPAEEYANAMDLLYAEYRKR